MPSSRFAFLLTCSLVLSFYSTGPALAAAPAQVLEAEIVIYGGTSAGVAAAVECSRLGKSSLIIEPSNHLGGLTSGGLGWTDSGNKAVIGGISREYYQRIKREYDRPETWAWQKSSEYNRYDPKSDALWVFEPHVAEKVYRDLVQEYKIPVYFNERLDLKKPVLKQGSQIVEFVLESGIRVRGKRFIDATYEGDLMAKAGISYTVGREANSQYNETINGVQKVKTVKHQFEASISPFRIPGNPASGLLPGIHGDDPGEDGQGDHRVQAYCFRMCLTNHPENRIPFPKPE
ncbi:MAG: FAD-dependent oxidoreductase, partial [Planctomycetaceae bacterium]|nr:FAD-dependent oxidoreductase [Planctomycetaceae bacterium]